jgi:ribosomal protein S20
MSLVDVMVKKGIIHENAGNRYKSRLARRAGASGT